MKNKKNLETKLEMPLGRPMDFFKGIVNGWRICYTLTEEEREKYYPKTKTERNRCRQSCCIGIICL